MKWAERWIARAQGKADEREERCQRRLAGVRAGQVLPGVADGLIAHQQFVADGRRASDEAWFRVAQIAANPAPAGAVP